MPRLVISLSFSLALALSALACASSDTGSEDLTGPDAGAEAPASADASPSPTSPDAAPGSTPDAAPTAPDAAPTPLTLTPDQQALFDGINAERTAAGVGALTVRADLLCAAQAHSDDIGAAEVCQINGTGGQTPQDRVVTCAGPSLAATLVGCGYLSGTATADGWAADNDIVAILLDPQLTEVGVGANNYHWTAIFDR